jgi:hypothetical protein
MILICYVWFRLRCRKAMVTLTGQGVRLKKDGCLRNQEIIRMITDKVPEQINSVSD